MSRHTTIALLLGGLGLPRTYAPGLLTELVGPNAPGERVPPELPGWGERFGEVWAGPLQPGFSLTPAVVPDDGGVRLAVVAVDPPAGEYRIRVGGVEAFSGVPGRGPRIAPSGPVGAGPGVRRELRFVVPAGLPPGFHGVEVTGPAGLVQTFPGAVRIVRRPRRSRCYSLRSLMPAGAYAAGRGLVDPTQEEVLDS